MQINSPKTGDAAESEEAMPITDAGVVFFLNTHKSRWKQNWINISTRNMAFIKLGRVPSKRRRTHSKHSNQ